jgi:deferrochelatase/peroxidase EfeB
MQDAGMSSLNESAAASGATRESMLDLHEIQATVLRQRPAPYFGTHVALRVDGARAGRELIRRLTPHVDSAASWWSADNPWLFVGISYAGLEVLGVPRDSLQSFPEAFRVGMAARARQLGDEGINDPKNWDPPFGKGEIHFGVSAFADSEEQRRRVLAIAREQYASFSGVSVLRTQDFPFRPNRCGVSRPRHRNVQCPPRRRVLLPTEPVRPEMVGRAGVTSIVPYLQERSHDQAIDPTAVPQYRRPVHSLRRE